LFKRYSYDKIIGLLTIYVDDIVITADSERVNSFCDEIGGVFSVKRLGEISTLLGINFSRSHSGALLMNQSQYINTLAERFCLGVGRSLTLPLDQNAKIFKNEDALDHEIQQKFQELIGCLLYLSVNTRPDIAVSVSLLTRHTSNPNRLHLSYAFRILRYLISTKYRGLVYSKSRDLNYSLTAWSDSDWGGDQTDRSSTSGFAIDFCGCLISWRSTKQKSISKSSVEAEYIAASECSSELVWLLKLCNDLDITFTKTPQMLLDSSGARALIKNGCFTRKTKHIEIASSFITNNVENGLFMVDEVNTSDNPADIFTKLVGGACFEKHLNKLAIRDTSFEEVC
jgi:Reverse transcriptase (RNA-dependent DNA polymerase)